LPLTSDMRTARSSINGLRAKGWTYIPSGIVWGWRTLEGESRSKSQLSHEGTDITDANNKTARLCESVKRDDIEVYTITYALDDDATKILMQNCASSPAQFFDAETSEELGQAFEQIGRSLETLRIAS